MAGLASAAASRGVPMGVANCHFCGETQVSPNGREDAANKGIRRPVGSKVKQFPLCTGVVGPVPKLMRRHRKTPSLWMLYQPDRPRPARKSAVWKNSSKAAG